MPNYRRAFVPGGTWFFTVNLFDRRRTLLTDHITVLRTAFKETQNKYPFEITAIVVLPDHLHAILTLSPNDADFPRAGDCSDQGSQKLCRSRNTVRVSAGSEESEVFGSGVYGNI
jgi:REP element-mobilizing transposase RayT